MGALRRRHADQHLGAKHEEADGKEAGRLHHIAEEGHQPQRPDRQQDPHRKDEVHRATVAVEQLVRSPTRHQGADKAPYLEHGDGRVGAHQIEAALLGHVEVAPVIDGGTHHIDQHVAAGEQPDIGVAQHIFAQDLAMGEPRILSLLGQLHGILAPLAYCRQPHGARGIPQSPAEEQSRDDGDKAGHYHAVAPAMLQGDGADDKGNERPAHVVGGVPGRPPDPALGTRIPAGEQLGAGGPAPALEEGVGDPKGGKHPECRREAEQDIDNAGGHQPDAHEVARVGAVTDDAGEELGAAVGDVEQSPQHADIGLVQHAARQHVRHGEVEALAGEVEDRVAQIHGQQQVQPPVAIGGIDLGLIPDKGPGRCASHKTQHRQALWW